MLWVDNADQHLVILPFSIKTVKVQKIFFCLLPYNCPMPSYSSRYPNLTAQTLTPLHAKCIKNIHNNRRKQ